MNKNSLNNRRQQIVDLIAEKGEISVRELVERFDVTGMTIRRDLEKLEAEHKLTRTHGGAVFTRPSVIEFAFRERSREHIQEKKAIAKATAELIGPNSTIILDTGTTTLQVAHAIAGISGLMVMTSSLAIASALYGRDNVKVVRHLHVTPVAKKR